MKTNWREIQYLLFIIQRMAKKGSLDYSFKNKIIKEVEGDDGSGDDDVDKADDDESNHNMGRAKGDNEDNNNNAYCSPYLKYHPKDDINPFIIIIIITILHHH